MKGKSTKSALLMSFTSLLLCFAMLIGCTFAWFTDSVTSGVNKIVAGNLDIEVTHSNAKVTDEDVTGNTSLFRDKDGNEVKWEPGVIAYENFKIANVGTLAFKYNMAMSVADYNELGGHNLLEVLKVAIVEGGFGGKNHDGNITREDVSGLSFDKSVSDFTDTGYLVPAGKEDTTTGIVSNKTFGVVIYWEPTNHDNYYNANNNQVTSDGQPLFVDLGINLIATQKDYEKDSFDEKYDLQAPLNSLASIINVEAKGNIKKDADLDGEIEIVDKATGGKVKAVVPAVDDIDFKYKVKGTNEFKTPDVHEAGHDDTLVLTFKTEKVEAGSVTYEISLKNETHNEDIAETNRVVKVTANIGKNLKGVKVKHSGVAMTENTTGEDQTFSYNATTGELTIWSKTFSPFEVSWTNEGPVAEVSKVDPATIGVVNVYTVPDISNSKGTSTLATAYNFKALDTTTNKGGYAYINGANEKYSLWHADFVVTVDSDIKANTAGLWGDYGGYANLGFDLPQDYTKGSEVRLLKDAANISMTYGEICRDVVNFKCGAFNFDSKNIGKTMTVELRLYETKEGENSYKNFDCETGKYITVGAYTYTFANTQTFTPAN